MLALAWRTGVSHCLRHPGFQSWCAGKASPRSALVPVGPARYSKKKLSGWSIFESAFTACLVQELGLAGLVDEEEAVNKRLRVMPASFHHFKYSGGPAPGRASGGS